jgi:putative DNA primase/helicase
MVTKPATLPRGYDAADALAAGLTPADLAGLRWVAVPAPAPAAGGAPAAAPAAANDAASGLPYPFEVRDGGIYYAKPQSTRSKSGGDTPLVWVCSELRVTALTRDDRGEDFGRLVEFTDPDGNPRRELVAAADLQGSGEALRARLARVGLEVSTHPEARRAFLELLQRWRPEARARSTPRTGWTLSGCSYVLPNMVVGNEPEPVILAGELAEGPAFAVQGTVEDWRRYVGLLCVGNSRLLFCVSAAFAAPLLYLIGAESGGFHLRGSTVDGSSNGKTTSQYVAASVCGPPKILQSWRSTANALEATAEAYNDALLILDEFGRVEAKEAGETAYTLSNGTGKARMGRNGEARPVKYWRLLFLSSGETGLAEHMATAGKKSRAGQEVRMAEIPADAGAGLGVFENLHGSPDGAAFALRLKDAAATHCGAPFVGFLEALVQHRAKLPGVIKSKRDDFVADALAGITDPSGQVRRVAQRFALVAVGGELATAEGITGWPEGAAYDAALRCFGDWLAARGGPVPAEERDLLAQVRHWFERHSNRLAWKDRAERLDDHMPEVPQRAGWKENKGGILCYYVGKETFAREICEGHDSKEAARVLIRRGLLLPDSEGKSTQNVRVPGAKEKQRMYAFTADSVAGGADDGP